MRKAVCLVLIALALFFGAVISSDARDGRGFHEGGRFHGGGHFGGHFGGRHFHGGDFGADVWIGPGWGWDPWWWGPSYYPYYPYNPYYYSEPQQPPVYVQPAPQPEEQYYWYFCQNPQGYYPYVKKCPGGWLKVVPPAAPDEEE